MIDHKKLAREMVDWFKEEGNYSVVKFAVERGLSKDKLFRLAGEDGELQEALDYALSMQEYRVCDGAITGALERNVALKMLETYAAWKGDVNILQKNEYKQFMTEARVKAERILRSIEGKDTGGGRGGIDGSGADEKDSVDGE